MGQLAAMKGGAMIIGFVQLGLGIAGQRPSSAICNRRDHDLRSSYHAPLSPLTRKAAAMTPVRRHNATRPACAHKYR